MQKKIYILFLFLLFFAAGWQNMASRCTIGNGGNRKLSDNFPVNIIDRIMLI